MTLFDRCRRAASVVLVVACLILVPGTAMARFTANQAPSLNVSTDTMRTPTGVTGSFTCSSPPTTEQISVSVTGFSDAGPTKSYIYTVRSDSGATVTTTDLSRTQTLTTSQPDNNAATTWTLTIQSTRNSWTGVAYTKAILCNRKSDNTGSL